MARRHSNEYYPAISLDGYPRCARICHVAQSFRSPTSALFVWFPLVPARRASLSPHARSSTARRHSVAKTLRETRFNLANLFRIRTYKKYARNPFTIRTYENIRLKVL
jgi:hypothetical protein